VFRQEPKRNEANEGGSAKGPNVQLGEDVLQKAGEHQAGVSVTKGAEADEKQDPQREFPLLYPSTEKSVDVVPVYDQKRGGHRHGYLRLTFVEILQHGHTYALRTPPTLGKALLF